MRCRELPKPKICFCAFNAYPLLSRANIEFIGGAELQQVLLGKELVKNGYDVSFIVLDYGQKSFETINGIKIYKTVPGGYLSGVKSIYFAVKCVWNALKQADADIHFQECGGYYTGFVALFCLLKRRIFVFQLASDMDVDGTFIKNAKLYERILYNFGIKRADCIIAQSDYQQELLKKNYNQDSIVIKNPYPIEEVVEISKSTPPVVLWVGTIKPRWKQPDLFLKLANAIPDARFQMVGGSSTNKQFYEQIKEEAKRISNLEFVGFVPYPDVNKYFTNASILVNTSCAEGFSNTFLQAWTAYTPVITLNADPDEIICKYKLGFHSRTFEQLIEDVKTLLKDETLRNRMGVNGRWYAESEHDIKKIVKKYAEIFEDVYER